MAWEEKCIGCLCNSCFYKDMCCGKQGGICKKRKNCKEYDRYTPELEDNEEMEGSEVNE